MVQAKDTTYYAKQRKIFVFGGGEGPVYYNDLYVLDTGRDFGKEKVDFLRYQLHQSPLFANAYST
jgi:hypothetical protein